jgi:hypothetical protein
MQANGVVSACGDGGSYLGSKTLNSCLAWWCSSDARASAAHLKLAANGNEAACEACCRRAESQLLAPKGKRIRLASAAILDLRARAACRTLVPGMAAGWRRWSFRAVWSPDLVGREVRERWWRRQRWSFSAVIACARFACALLRAILRSPNMQREVLFSCAGKRVLGARLFAAPVGARYRSARAQ